MDCKKLAYITLVRFGMEYAFVIWNPYTKCDSEKLERVQHSAARWIVSYLPSPAYPAWTTGRDDEYRYRGCSSCIRSWFLNDQAVVLVASVDFILSSRPSRGINADSQKLVTVRSLKTTDGLTALGQWEIGTLCLSPLCQLVLQHSSRASWPVISRHRCAAHRCNASARCPVD